MTDIVSPNRSNGSSFQRGSIAANQKSSGVSKKSGVSSIVSNKQRSSLPGSSMKMSGVPASATKKVTTKKQIGVFGVPKLKVNNLMGISSRFSQATKAPQLPKTAPPSTPSNRLIKPALKK